MKAGLLALLLLVTGVAAQAPSSNDLRRAETYYQQGTLAESMSDSAFQRWVRTISVGNLDAWTTRTLFAIDMYTNATRLNPAHWRAHKRLGFLYAEARGTMAHTALAIEHLVVYMALAPTDPETDRAKGVTDELVSLYMQRAATEATEAEGALYFYLSLDESSKNDAFPNFVRDYAEVSLPQAAGEFIALAKSKAGQMSNEFAGGGAGGGGGGGEGADPTGGLAKRELLEVPRPAAMAGVFRSTAEEAGNRQTRPMQGLETNLVRASSYINQLLLPMGQMHNYMRFFDQQGIPYDPRMPQALIGECVAQFRWVFVHNHNGDLMTPADLQADYARFARLGGATTADLFATRNYINGLPQLFLQPTTVKEPERDRLVAASLRAASALDSRGGANGLAATALAANEAEKAFLRWRWIYFGHVAAHYGLGEAQDLLIRDYNRVGGGEMTTWLKGPLPRAQRVVERPVDAGWLLAAR